MSNGTQVVFRSDSRFYASYDGQGSYANTLGLFDQTQNDLINCVSFSSRIICWNTLKDDRVFVLLENSDVVLLDTQLSSVKMWNLAKHWRGKDNIIHCTGDKNNQLWLATDHSGLFKLNLNNETISNPVKTEYYFKRLTVSQDGKYLGTSEINSKGDNTVKVYQIQK